MEHILVIFDMDGVLVNTLPMLKSVYRQFLNQFGIKGSEKEFSRLNGYTIREVAAYLKTTYHLKDGVEALYQGYKSLIADNMGNASLSDGAEEILSFLKNYGCIVGVASSAVRSYIDFMLCQYKIERFIDFVVSGEDVCRAKPFTEIYECACGKREYDRCYIVEDSDNGIKAAQIGDSRCNTIFYQGTQNFSLEDYQYRINDLRQIRQIVQNPEMCRSFIPVSKVRLQVIDGKGDGKEWYNDKEVDRVWQEELKENPALFNGEILCLHALQTETGKAATLQAYNSEYKYYRWTIRRKMLYNYNSVIPIAVSAILLDRGNYTLLARRCSVTQYRKRYELIPSGSLEAIEPLGPGRFMEQIKKELKEELSGNIRESDLESVEIIGMSFDIAEQVMDICFIINLHNDLTKWNGGSNEEYEEESLICLSVDEILKNDSLCEDLVPTSLEILKHIRRKQC